MKRTTKLLGLIISFGLASSAFGQMVVFDFTAGSLAGSANTTNLVVSDVSSESSFNSFADTSDWDSAAQISGANNFFSAPTTQAATEDAITFTITATSGYHFSISDFSFQARSTNTAPADIGFTINDASYDFSSSYSNNSIITTISQNSLGLNGLTSATISIQGWNASGSSELQLDNIQVTGTVVPEPNTYALLSGCCALGFVMLRCRK